MSLIKIPIRKDIVIPIGTDYDFQVTLKSNGEVISLDGWDAWAEIRDSDYTLIASFVVALVDGVISASLANNVTADFAPNKKAIWSLRVESSSGKRFDLFAGNCSIVRNATVPSVS